MIKSWNIYKLENFNKLLLHLKYDFRLREKHCIHLKQIFSVTSHSFELEFIILKFRDYGQFSRVYMIMFGFFPIYQSKSYLSLYSIYIALYISYINDVLKVILL